MQPFLFLLRHLGNQLAFPPYLPHTLPYVFIIFPQSFLTSTHMQMCAYAPYVSILQRRLITVCCWPSFWQSRWLLFCTTWPALRRWGEVFKKKKTFNLFDYSPSSYSDRFSFFFFFFWRSISSNFSTSRHLSVPPLWRFSSLLSFVWWLC